MRMKSMQYVLTLLQEREYDVKEMISKLGNDHTAQERVLAYYEELDTIQHTMEELKLNIRKGKS